MWHKENEQLWDKTDFFYPNSRNKYLSWVKHVHLVVKRDREQKPEMSFEALSLLVLPSLNPPPVDYLCNENICK